MSQATGPDHGQPGRQAACPAAASLAGPDRPDLLRSLVDAASAALAVRLDRRCRRLVATRLDLAWQASFAPIMAQASGNAALVADVLAGLDVVEIVELLRERRDRGLDALLRGLAASPDPMLREAGLSCYDPPGLAANPRADRHDGLCIDHLLRAVARSGTDPERLDGAERQLRRDPFGDREAAIGAGEAMLPTLLRQADHGAATRCLARSAMVAESVVARAIRDRDAHGLVSLAWKAGFSMRTAVSLQVGLAGISPASVLRPTGSGACPLGRAQIAWRLRELAAMPD